MYSGDFYFWPVQWGKKAFNFRSLSGWGPLLASPLYLPLRQSLHSESSKVQCCSIFTKAIQGLKKVEKSVEQHLASQPCMCLPKMYALSPNAVIFCQWKLQAASKLYVFPEKRLNSAATSPLFSASVSLWVCVAAYLGGPVPCSGGSEVSLATGFDCWICTTTSQHFEVGKWRETVTRAAIWASARAAGRGRKRSCGTRSPIPFYWSLGIISDMRSLRKILVSSTCLPLSFIKVTCSMYEICKAKDDKGSALS